jgi:hypothetical protein
MHILFDFETDHPTDRPTIRPIDHLTIRPTDIVTYRAAIAANNNKFCVLFGFSQKGLS